MRLFLLLVAALAGLAACAPAEAPPTLLMGGAPAGTVAEAACVSAVEGQTSRVGVTVSASEASGPGTVVTLAVPGAAEPWSCLASADGRVERVTYAGSEGAS